MQVAAKVKQAKNNCHA